LISYILYSYKQWWIAK